MKLGTFVFGMLSCLILVTGCEPYIENLCASNPEMCTAAPSQPPAATPTVAPTAEEDFPAWCNENAASDPETADALPDSGKWIATCGNDVWTLMVSAKGDKTVSASGTNGSITSDYVGVMAYNCVYLVPTDPSAPVITGSRVALFNTGVYVAGGSCVKLLYDTLDQ